MKKQNLGVFNYDIASVYADTGLEPVNPDFFVFSSEQITVDRNIGKPSRSSHFGFILVTEGYVNAKLNLIEYHLPASSLFIIPPSLVHEFLGRSENAAITAMVFSDKFLNNSGIAGKHVDAFTFLGTNADLNAVNVQNRVQRATNLLPAEVTRAGVTVDKQQSSNLLFFSIYSANPDYDQKYLSNYSNINIVPVIKRINGVGGVNVFGAKIIPCAYG